MPCLSVSLHPASADGVRKSVVFKSQRAPRPLTATLKSQRVPEPLSMAENVLSQVNLKENYSCNWSTQTFCTLNESWIQLYLKLQCTSVTSFSGSYEYNEWWWQYSVPQLKVHFLFPNALKCISRSSWALNCISIVKSLPCGFIFRWLIN